MYKLIALLVAVTAVSLSAQESQAQCYRGGSGFSIGVGNFNRGFGYGGFGGVPYGRSVGGLSISVGNGFGGGFGPGFGGGFGGVYGRPVGGFYGSPYARPVVVPVTRGYYGGGVYRGGYGRSCGGW